MIGTQPFRLMNVYLFSWAVTGVATMIAYWHVRRKLLAQIKPIAFPHEI